MFNGIIILVCFRCGSSRSVTSLNIGPNILVNGVSFEFLSLRLYAWIVFFFFFFFNILCAILNCLLFVCLFVGMN